MKKSKKGLAPDGGQQLELSFAADSHANHIPQPENGLALKMTATCGPKLSELLANSGPTQLFLKTFLDSQALWSQRVLLEWKAKRVSRFVKVTYLVRMNVRSVKKWKSHSRSFSSDSWLQYLKTLRKVDMNPRKRQAGVQSFFVFQLVPSALPTEGTGFGLLPTPAAQEGFNTFSEGENIITSTGSIRHLNPDGSQSRVGLHGIVKSGLLPTPDCNNHRDGSKLRKDNNLEDGGRHGVSLHHLGAHGLLPTPQSRDEKNGSKLESGRIKRKMDDGYSLNLNDLAASGLLATPTSSMMTVPDMIQAKFHSSKRPEYSSLLPTPRAAEHKGTGPKGSKSNNHRLERDYLDAVVTDAVGKEGETCQLSHRFVMEMMGFPANWIESAFTKEEVMEPHGFLNFNQEYPTIDAAYKDALEAKMKGALNPATGKRLTAGKLNKEGLRMGGNAIVDDVAFEMFKALQATWE